MQHVITLIHTFFTHNLSLYLLGEKKIKGSKVSHFSLQDHPPNVIQLPFVRCRQLPLLDLSAPTQNWNRMMHGSAQELQKKSWLAQGSQKHVRQQ